MTDVLNKKIAREMSEKELQKNVIDMAHAYRWHAVHIRNVLIQRQGRWGHDASYYASPFEGDAGCPDLILARSGTVLLRELKAEGRKATPEQEAWLEASGGEIWTPSDWLSGKIEEALL